MTPTNLQVVKTQADLADWDEGVTLVTHDNNIVAVELRDSMGNGYVRIESGGTYSSFLKVLIPAKPVKQKRWVVTGQLLGAARVEHAFEHQHEAAEMLAKIERECRSESGLTIEERDVYIAPDGAVVSEDSIPF